MGWFGSDPFTDPQLGAFERNGGAWTTVVDLASIGRVTLRLAGDRKAPASESLALAREVSVQYAALRGEIARALHEHLEPYAAEGASDDADDAAIDPAEIRSAEEAFSRAEVRLVDVDASRTAFPIEVQLHVPWDEEHTLGVRIRAGKLVELCGSV